MRSEDIPINPRTRALIVRYEQDRPVIEATARDTLIRYGQEGDRDVASVVLHPYDAARAARSLPGQDWSESFSEHERFAAALLKREAELHLDHLPIHLFGCAPLALMLELASRLPRRPVCVYQQAPDGSWSLGYDRMAAPSAEDFFQVEGLPSGRQGGRGHVLLVVEVTRAIRDNVRSKVAAWLPEASILTTVCLRPVTGPSPTAVQNPGQVTRAATQLREVLDTLHERLDGAESVVLAIDAPVSFAAALGTVVNPTTQHPLTLLHFNADRQGYERVHVIRAVRAVAPRSPTADDKLNAMRVLREVQRVHKELVSWLKEPEQQPFVEHIDGQAYLRSEIEDDPAYEPTPLFRHGAGKWKLDWELLLGLGALRERLQSQEDWKECLRLFLIHEAFHVRQGGLTSYNYRGIGRAGFVLEAADYDADAVGVEVALAWRKARQGGTVKDVGSVKTLESIVWNSLEILRVFEPERPVRELAERRLRRYLIWLFHACRFSQLALRAPDAEVREELERVTVELVGLPAFRDPHESYFQQRVRLSLEDSREEVMLALYFRHRLVRLDNARAWVEDLLQALREWEAPPREELQDRLRLLFERLFVRHPELVAPRLAGAR
ncbi:SAVED domain-containing protein [Myxococcus sp. AM010]|uniref:SAVED domain-containing protein n=1 Tax=Myxococcus sp. AM010 TaxID=2745138 RepID=UPI001595A00E|nr:SAVED domain-containing protein [Myxococcus sp. AM010]NVJ18675.1 SAVED domain-containing protein [Myxococcus sp. AM010]